MSGMLFLYFLDDDNDDIIIYLTITSLYTLFALVIFFCAIGIWDLFILSVFASCIFYYFIFVDFFFCIHICLVAKAARSRWEPTIPFLFYILS